MYVILWFSAPLIATFFREPELLWLSRYAFTGFFIASFSITPRAILYKQLRVKEQAIIGIVSLLISGIVGVTMAFCGASYWSIVTQNIVFVTIVSIMSWWFSGFRPSRKANIQPIKEMFGFSFKLLITNVFNCINNSIFSVVFGKFFTRHEVGQYTQADKWNKMGSSMITGMVQQVAQPMFVQVADDLERQRRAFRKMLRFTSLLAFPAMFGLAMVAPEFVTVTVGEKWLPSAGLMRMLCIAGAFMPIAALYQHLLISRGRSNIYMWNILAQGILVLGLLCSIKYFDWAFKFNLFGNEFILSDVRLMVCIYVIVYLCWMFLWQLFLYREIRLSFGAALLDILPFATIATISMVATYFITINITNIYLLLASRIIIGATIYLALVWLTGAKILRECMGYIKKEI